MALGKIQDGGQDAFHDVMTSQQVLTAPHHK